MDSLKIRQRLKEAGVPQEQATAHAEICAEMYGNLVTKADLAATLEVLEGRPGQNMTGLAGMEAPEFLSNETVRLATETLLIRIGGALGKLSLIYGEEALSEYVPRLRETIRLLDILVDEYRAVADEETWGHVSTHLPDLLETVRALIEKEAAKADREIHEPAVNCA